MHEMGLRSVPLGETSCFSFNLFTNQWTDLPDVPVGKMNPTLIQVNSRFVFQIGGFDDFNFDIYRLDMRKRNRWKVLNLDTTQSIIDDSILLRTQEYFKARQNNLSKDDELSKVEKDSDDDSDIGFGQHQKLKGTESTVAKGSTTFSAKPSLGSLIFGIEEEKVVESLRDDMVDDDEDDYSNLALT